MEHILCCITLSSIGYDVAHDAVLDAAAAAVAVNFITAAALCCPLECCRHVNF